MATQRHTMRVLNLYAGIGGNRKLWDCCDVTAVERDPRIAEAYAELFPDDTLIVGDAREYLLEHFGSFDFVWSSPPCQSHSRMIRSGRNHKPRFPDLSLYEEIYFLEHSYPGSYVVENVIPYYKTLLQPQAQITRHVFWSNFEIRNTYVPPYPNFISDQNLDAEKRLKKWLDLPYTGTLYYGDNHCPTQVLRNCVHPKLGRYVFDCMLEALEPDQYELFGEQ